MLPTLAALDFAYVRLRDTVVFAKFRLAFAVFCPDCPDIDFRKFCRAVVSASGLAVFLGHVRHVLRVCPKEQVIGVDADSIVAFVTDVHPIRDWPPVDFISNPVRRNHLAVVLDRSITTTASCRVPKPASLVWLWGVLCVEPFSQCFFHPTPGPSTGPES